MISMLVGHFDFGAREFKVSDGSAEIVRALGQPSAREYSCDGEIAEIPFDHRCEELGNLLVVGVPRR